MMRTAALPTLAVLVLLAIQASAGKNEGGALIVHVQDLLYIPSYCYEWVLEPCEDTEDCFPEIESCETANTQAVGDPNFLMGGVVFFYAAFPDQSDPGVAVIYFGIDHNFPPGFIAGTGFCGPPGTIEIPDTGWPDDVNAGNSLAFGEPIAGDRLFRAYWFGVYGDEGFHLGSAINPTGGYAAFVSDDNPGILDEIDRFGQVRWGEPGFNECPEPLVLGACCFEDGSCLFLTEDACGDSGGHLWMGEGTVCDPNPCEPVDVEESTVGKIKASYR